jgi:hypothetical protein
MDDCFFHFQVATQMTLLGDELLSRGCKVALCAAKCWLNVWTAQHRDQQIAELQPAAQ